MRTLITVLAAFVLGAPTVQALDRGECDTPEAISAKLKAEDQHSFGSAERIVRAGKLNNFFGMIFTISTDRSVGYILQSDKPMGERASRFCIHERLADLRIYDAGKSGIPKQALLKATNSDAKRKCDEMIKKGAIQPDTCGTLNKSLADGERHGERLMFQGFNVTKQKDGTYAKDGTLSSVTAMLSESPSDPTQPLYGRIFFTTLPEGATIVNVLLVHGVYTPYGQSLLSN